MYVRKNTIPRNEQLWNKAVEEAKKRFRSESSSYAQIFARKWYKDHGGEWTSEKQKHSAKNENNNDFRADLMPFEQYVENDENKNETIDISEEKNKKYYWFREPLVDVSRPVLDEAGHVIGFHPCGSNTKDYQNSLSSYRTSYPRCMPRSKAMKMNAMEREKYLKTNRYLEESEDRDSNNYSEYEEE